MDYIFSIPAMKLMAVENNNIISSYQSVLSISTSPLFAQSNINCTGSHDRTILYYYSLQPSTSWLEWMKCNPLLTDRAISYYSIIISPYPNLKDWIG
jgi:hypothetical protein